MCNSEVQLHDNVHVFSFHLKGKHNGRDYGSNEKHTHSKKSVFKGNRKWKTLFLIYVKPSNSCHIM